MITSKPSHATCFQSGLAFLVTLVIAYSANAQQSGVRAIPGDVEFTHVNASVTVKLVKGDQIIPVTEVKRVRAMASEHDYIEMFIIEKPKSGPAQITVRPQPSALEVGSYDLVFETTSGNATLQVNASLSEIDDIVTQRAKATGMSEDEVRKDMQLITRSPRERVEVTLPEHIYVGQEFKLDMSSAPGRRYVWTINGEVASEGDGASVLTRVFEKAGDYTIAEKEYTGDFLVSSWTGALTVLEEAPVSTDLGVRSELVLKAPDGFSKVSWTLNNSALSEGQELRHKFTQPGDYTIVCTAREAKSGGDEFRRITWNVKVTP